ncbi:DUF3299 domain-containing protein [Vibrio alginolyticus]|nr:DUF3299 domain-containing protein [Vibrio alginolyticus]
MRFLILLVFISLALPSVANEVAMPNKTLEIEWLDLIPKEERDRISESRMKALNHNLEAAQQVKVGAVRAEMAGKHIRIPGFVIPLEGGADSISEFLLVPFYGACIHVPPPPPNQIIHVKFEEGAPTKDLWDIVYITGTLQTETLVTEELDVESGYTMIGASIENYNKA